MQPSPFQRKSNSFGKRCILLPPNLAVLIVQEHMLDFCMQLLPDRHLATLDARTHF